jgi:hypothetical protein
MNDSKAWIGFFIVGIIYIAILVMLVKPGSPAGAGVVSLSNGLADLVATAVGGQVNAPFKANPGNGVTTL